MDKRLNHWGAQITVHQRFYPSSQYILALRCSSYLYSSAQHFCEMQISHFASPLIAPQPVIMLRSFMQKVPSYAAGPQIWNGWQWKCFILLGQGKVFCNKPHQSSVTQWEKNGWWFKLDLWHYKSPPSRSIDFWTATTYFVHCVYQLPFSVVYYMGE